MTYQTSAITGYTTATPDYTMGFSEEFLEVLRWYTLEASAAYLLPYLRPGLRVLDFGCGTGTISVGMARAIEPGELHGVDMEQSQVELARSVSASQGRDNATFHVGDAAALEFPDDFFDLAHCHNVLMHIPDTQAVLREVKRVLKPGGIIACREVIADSCFTCPDFGVLYRGWNMFRDLLAADEGHPQMGKELKGHIVDAGFANLRMTASFSVYNSPDELDFIVRLVERWFLSPEITGAAIKYGASTEKLVSDLKVAFEKWRTHPGALCAVAFGEAIANKPA